jgi:hypothetical protein
MAVGHLIPVENDPEFECKETPLVSIQSNGRMLQHQT